MAENHINMIRYSALWDIFDTPPGETKPYKGQARLILPRLPVCLDILSGGGVSKSLFSSQVIQKTLRQKSHENGQNTDKNLPTSHKNIRVLLKPTPKSASNNRNIL